MSGTTPEAWGCCLAGITLGTMQQWRSFFLLINYKITLMTIAKHCSPPGSCSVKSPIGLRVIAIEEAVIQALTISAPLSTKNGLVETVQ